MSFQVSQEEVNEKKIVHSFEIIQEWEGLACSIREIREREVVAGQDN